MFKRQFPSNTQLQLKHATLLEEYKALRSELLSFSEYSRQVAQTSARAYAGRGERAALLWGVEQWLSSPAWMLSGRQALAVFRGYDHGRAEHPAIPAA